MGKNNSNPPGLEIDQDLDFQEKEWRIERVTWIVLGIIVVLALLGLFGTGPLSSATAGDDDTGFSVVYERFIRYEGETSIEFQISPDHVRDGQVELWISTVYLDGHEIQSTVPQADQERAEGDRQVFVFLTEDPNGPLIISFSLMPSTMARHSGEMGIVDGPAISVNQFSYP